jgi:hypothetical protein
MLLKDAIDVRDNPEHFDFFIVDERHHEGRYKVTFYDEYGGLDGSFFLCGHEYGATHLICARHESEAHEVWIDLLPTIPAEDVHEAYNAFDKMVDWMESKGHENDYQLRHFCSRWCKTFFDIETRQDDDLGLWELDKAFEIQSNCTDTGIVYVGHNEWMNEIDPSKIEVVRKSEVTA